jgi:CHAD domain-containing protein
LQRLEECQREPSAESIHQLRVATRRLISQLFILRAILPGSKSQRACRILKQQLQSLGPLRDLHIQRGFVEGQEARFPEAVILSVELARQERALVKPASRRINHAKASKLARWINRIFAELGQILSETSEREQLTELALCCADSAFSETVQRRQLVVLSDLRTIHRTRVAFKKFRYIVECLPPDVTGLGRRQLRNLAFYQRKMGHIQDLVVIHRGVSDFMRRHKALESWLRPLRAYLRSRQARALRSFEKSMDRLFQFWPPPGLPVAALSEIRCPA